MPKIKRVVRKLGRAEEHGVDTQFWPVVVALCVLTSFLLGAVLTLLNGPMLWISLMVMPAGLAAAIIALANISHRRVRRGLQLAIILSLIVHVVFLLSAYRVNVFGRWVSQNNARSTARAPKTIQIPVETPQQPWNQVNVTPTPEREIEEPEREPEPIEPTPERVQPTPVEQPREQVDPNQVERRDAAQTSPRFSEQSSKLSRSEQRQQVQSETRVETSNTSNASSQNAQTQPSEVQPTQVTRAEQQPQADRINESTPEKVEVAQNTPTRQRPEDQRSATSPQTNADPIRRPNPRPTTEAQIDTQAIVESRPTASQPSPRQPTTSTTEIAETNPLPRRREVTPSPTINPRADQAELPSATAERLAQSEQPRPVRRERTSDQPSTTVTPEVAQTQTNQPQRPTAEVNPSPSTNVPAPNSNANPTEVAQSTTPNEAASRPLQRQSVTPSEPTRQSPDPSEANTLANNPRPTRSNNATRQPRAEDANALAQSNTPTNRPRTNLESAPAPQNQPAEVVANTAPRKATDLAVNPSSSDVARQPTSDPTSTRSQISAPRESTGLTAQVPQVSPNANPQSTEPTVSTNQAAELPRRSIASSEVAVSPTAAESPTEAPTTKGNRTSIAPSERFSVDRSTQGVAGAGESRNLDRDVPANERPAITASNSARRPESTTQETGQTFQPSQRSQVRQSVAGQLTPSSSVTAEVENGVGVPSSNEPGEISADASATIVDSRSPSQVDDVSALRGSADIDLGPPKIVENTMTGRGVGGGQPEPTPEQSQEQSERVDRGTLQNSIASNVSAEVPSSPLEEGHSDPIATRENPNANSLARSESDGSQRISGGPTNTELRGPTDLTSEAPDVGVTSVARAETADAIPADEQPGGGELDDEDEEERERRRRRSQSGGAELGQLAVNNTVELPASGGERSDADAPTTTGDLAASESGTERVANATTPGGERGERESAEPASASGGDVAAAPLSRSEISDGTPAPAAPGGGTESRRRNTPSVSIAGPVDVETVTASTPDRGSEGPATGLEANDTEASRIAGSTEGIVRSSLGVMATQLAGPAISAIPPIVMNPSGDARDAGEGEAEFAPETVGSKGNRRIGSTGPTTNTQVDVELATGTTPGGSTGTDVGMSDELSPSESGRLRRNRQPSGGGVEVRVAADEGPGGLGSEVTPQVGVNDRRARLEEGPIQAFADSRFIRENPGGIPSFNPTVAIPTDAFKSRKPLGGGRGSPQTEEAIEMGLAFLARHQQPEGHWKLDTFGSGTGDADDETPVFKTDTAATGLALLAFQGAGYNHVDYKYAKQLHRAVFWLVEHQADDGCLYVEGDNESNLYCRLYGHAIAALALSEAYGMTQDARLKEAAQKALDYIVSSQDMTRGGWRYTPGRSSDTSVSGWMMMALKSGQLAGLRVPPATYDRIEDWLDVAQVPNSPHQFRYNPYADNSPERRHGREASRSMTAVGLLMRLYSGWDRQNQNMLQGCDYILEQLPGQRTSVERDTYYWYYATQVLRHVGGERWERWNGQLHPLLISSQVREPQRVRVDPSAGNNGTIEDNALVGSWDPLDPVPDAWGITGGRIYVTALNLLSLEVDYRLLPLYQETVDERD